MKKYINIEKLSVSSVSGEGQTLVVQGFKGVTHGLVIFDTSVSPMCRQKKSTTSDLVVLWFNPQRFFWWYPTSQSIHRQHKRQFCPVQPSWW